MATAIGEYGLGWLRAENVVADQPDVAALVRTYSATLYRVAYSVLRNPAEAEDAVQETFLRVVERPHQIIAIRDLRPWRIRITWNLALDRRRRIRPQQMNGITEAALISAAPSADQQITGTTQIAAVLAAIDRLPKREREVLLLTAVEELTTAEIAAILDRSESSVRSLIFRARIHLKQRLEKGGWR